MNHPETADQMSLEDTLVALLEHGCTPQWSYSEDIARAVVEKASERGLDVEGPVEDGGRWMVRLT